MSIEFFCFKIQWTFFFWWFHTDFVAVGRRVAKPLENNCENRSSSLFQVINSNTFQVFESMVCAFEVCRMIYMGNIMSMKYCLHWLFLCISFQRTFHKTRRKRFTFCVFEFHWHYFIWTKERTRKLCCRLTIRNAKAKKKCTRISEIIVVAVYKEVFIIMKATVEMMTTSIIFHSVDELFFSVLLFLCVCAADFADDLQSYAINVCSTGEMYNMNCAHSFARSIHIQTTVWHLNMCLCSQLFTTAQRTRKKPPSK